MTKIDRLARSILDLHHIVGALRDKGVKVRFLDEGMTFEAGAERPDSLQVLLFHILGSFAQFERDLILERTAEGRERARRQGKHMGRPGPDEKAVKRAIKLYNDRERNGMSVKDIVRVTGVPRSTLYVKAKNEEAVNSEQV